VCLNSSGRWGRVRKVTEVHAEPLCHTVPDLWLRRLRLDRGVPWEAAEELLGAAAPDEDNLQGYYMRPLERASPEPVLAIRRRGRDIHTYTLYIPHAAPTNLLGGALCTLERFQNSNFAKCKASPTMLEAVGQSWNRSYERSARECIHKLRGQNCKEGSLCQVGVRCVEQTMLTGPILAHWDTLVATKSVKACLVRASIAEGRVLVGIMIGEEAIVSLRDAFARRAPRAPPALKRKPTGRRRWDPLDVEAEPDDLGDEFFLSDDEPEPAGRPLAARQVDISRRLESARSGAAVQEPVPWHASAAAAAAVEAEAAAAKRRRVLPDSPAEVDLVSDDSSPERMATDPLAPPARFYRLPPADPSETFGPSAVAQPSFPRRPTATQTPVVASHFFPRPPQLSAESESSAPSSLGFSSGVSTSAVLNRNNRLAEMKARIAEKQRAVLETKSTASAQQTTAAAETQASAGGSGSGIMAPAPQTKPLDAIREAPKYSKEIWFKNRH